AGAGEGDGSVRAAGLLHTSAALGLPLRRGGPASAESPLEPTRETLAAALARATLSWEKPACEGRVRVEPGQGETWVLLASPCGTESETEQDAGLTALFIAAAAELAKTSPDTHVEPWITPDGAGLLVHGPALPGEGPAAHARRLADLAGRSFAADALPLPALGRARAELLRRDAQADGRALGVLAGALTPGHPSWVLATGRDEILARASDAAIAARAEALRTGPLRVAVLAGDGAAQGDAAVRAVDRWIDRRGGETRACRSPTATVAPRAGTYGIELQAGGIVAEAYLAFPLAPNDVAERSAASLIAAALDGAGGVLEKALGGGAPLATSWSARVLGVPRAPALVIRLVATQASLDGAVMQTRAVLDRLWRGGLGAADLERGVAVSAREAVTTALDPRARVVATWRGEPVPTSAQSASRGKTSLDELRAFAAKRLGEESLVIVAARPPLVKAVPAEAPATAPAASKAP
ncbi:MAG: exonuclease SbcC, partial [Labilithrix sp.]|nr:exonuclease SbcC [Labilithrix sp.]